MWNDRGPHRSTVFNVKKRRQPKSLTYRLAVLTAPIFLLPIFAIMIVAFCLVLVPLLYMLISAIIIRSGWGPTEVDVWVDEGRGS